MYRSSKRATPRSSMRMRKFKRIVESCDLVLAGNNFLKEQALKFTSEDRLVVIPTVVDLTTYPIKNHGPSSNEIVLGWIGSAGTLYYLNRILPTLEKVASRFRHVCLKIVCDQFLESSTIRVIKKPWNESDEVSDLQSFDIGIMPLTDDLWARGKCALKIVQYMAVGIPVVCSPVGTNRDIVRDGLNGFWAETEREWIDRLGILIENEELRRKMGRAGRQIVEEGYSLNAVGDRLVRIFKEL
jgi:glycosyltransferase involved in cell wall biosynthesis